MAVFVAFSKYGFNLVFTYLYDSDQSSFSGSNFKRISDSKMIGLVWAGHYYYSGQDGLSSASNPHSRKSFL